MKSAAGKRVLILDPLRGLAACSVMWAHFTNAGEFLRGPAPGYAALRASGSYGGGWGVFAFFVISGFVLPYSLQHAGYRPADFGRFVYKRLLRLEPPYLVALALTVGLSAVAQFAPGFQGPPFRIEWHRLALHLAYLNAWSDYPWYNDAFWTLAIEFQFYLALGVLFPLVVHPRLAVRAMVPVALGALSFTSAEKSLLVHHLALFALGIATAQHHLGMLPRRMYLAMAAALSVAVCFTFSFPLGVGGVAAAALIAGLGHARAEDRVGRALRAAPLVWLGALSYSVYLLHLPVGNRVLNIGERFADAAPAKLVVLLVAVAATLAVAHVHWRLVEVPSQRLSSRVRYRGSARQGAAAAEPAVSGLTG